jgi:hypothetical protein
MTKHPLQTLIFTCAVSAGSFSVGQAQNLVTNGGFELGSGSGTTRSFDVTTTWFNRGTGDQTQVARRESTDTGSLFVGQINDRYDVVNATSDFDSAAFGPILHNYKTSYTIQTGDSFNFSYEWATAFDWNLGLDEVRFVLFATDDDTLGGNVVWSSIHDSGTAAAAGTYETVSQTSSTVTAAAANQALFVNLYGFQNNGALSGNTGFARVDNVNVSVIPEPSAFALIAGVLMLGFTGMRRR